MRIFIGGAWPYTNDSLHLGHIAGLLPGDVLARYFRLKGDDVLYVSGSDCHGTPICIRANLDKVTPAEIAKRYHEEFALCFSKLGFSYDLYSKTNRPEHHELVQSILKKLIDGGYIYEHQVRQTFCPQCSMFLPDRYIEGDCPNCGSTARGDQCENCNELLEPSDLIGKRCRICGTEPQEKETGHLFFALSAFQKKLERYIKDTRGWRENAVNLSRRYLREGLKDRTVTRDLPWGVDVPLEGYEGKKIYVWIDAVCGYLSASQIYCREHGRPWEDFWKDEDIRAYYIHGKDNIPFHTLILPALLMGAGELHLPDRIISSEYLTIEGNKFSKSRNWAVWAPYILDRYDPDSIRYFLLINGPERRDSDFSWREFINRHNGELLGAYGNLVNRTLSFINKYYEGRIPAGKTFTEVKSQTKALYKSSGAKIEGGEFKGALEEIFAYVRGANKFFDEHQPWLSVKNNPKDCEKVIYTLVQIIANLSNLLEPFTPFSSSRIRGFLGLQDPAWQYVETAQGQVVEGLSILFQRIDKEKIDEESNRLG